MDSRKARITNKKVELAWSLAKTEEAQYAAAQKERTELGKKVEMNDSKISNLLKKQKHMKQEKKEIEGEIQNLAKQAIPEGFNEMKKVMQEKREEARKAKREMQEVKSKMEKARRTVSNLQAEIERQEKSGTDEFKQRMAERNEAMKILEQEIGANNDQIRTHQTHLSNLDNDYEALTNERNEFKAGLNKIRNEVRTKESELRKIRSEKGNKMVLFGENMPRFLAEIKKAKFHRQPIGPIGSEIQLKPGISKEEAQLVEAEIQQLLPGFIVENFEDHRVLNGIQNKLKTNFPVISTKFLDTKHDISNGKCKSDYPTMFDLIECPNVVVSNCLIDQKKLERVIVIPSDEEAQNLLKSRASVPQNLLHAMTHSFTQLHPAPKYRSYAMPVPGNKKQVLSCSVDDMIEELELQVGEKKEELKRHEEKDNAFETRFQQTEGERRKAARAINDIKATLKHKNFELSKLKTEAETETPPDIEALVEDREKYQETAEEHAKVLEEKTDLYRSSEEKSEKAKQEVDTMKTEQEKRLSRMDPLKEQLEVTEKAIVDNEKERDYAMNKKEDYLRRFRSSKADEDQKEAKMREKTQDAMKYGAERPEVIGESDKLVKEICSLQHEIMKSKKITDSKEDVITKLEDLQKHLRSVREKVDQLEDHTNHLNRMIEKRKRGFHCIQNSLARITQMNFSIRLDARSYSGEIKIDYEKFKLELTVNPEGNSEEKRRDMRTLSGGEKSYSTISLILSLWDLMQPPFRILDEFDVFMDMINRRIALDQIISYARESKNFQYIFLTPLNTSNIQTGKELSIVRLEK